MIIFDKNNPPKFEDMINQVICGDCIEVMKHIPDKSVDLVIISPPFNIGNSQHTGNIKHKTYNDEMDEPSYQLWQTHILNILFNKSKTLFYQHKNRIKDGVQITPYQWILKTDWIVKQEIVWFNGSQNFDKCRFYPMTERVYWLSDSKESEFKNNINSHDLFKWKSVGAKRLHKRMFPESLCLDIIQCFPDNYIIMDCFSGSGTTAVACKQLGRKFIAIEKEKKYCEIAERRLAQSYLF